MASACSHKMIPLRMEEMWDEYVTNDIHEYYLITVHNDYIIHLYQTFNLTNNSDMIFGPISIQR